MVLTKRITEEVATERAANVRGGGEEILEAAAHCFKENGFAATSIDTVARSLGATKGMIYHHFQSKTDLFFSVYKRGMEINEEVVRPYVDGDYTSLLKLTYMGMAHATNMMAQQHYQRVLAQGVVMHQRGSTTAAQRETMRSLIDSRDEYQALFHNVIVSTSEDENIPIADVSLATKSFLAVLNSTVFWYTAREGETEISQQALARQLVEFALKGLGTEYPAQADYELELN